MIRSSLLLFICTAVALPAQPGRLNVTSQTTDAKLKEHPVMISAIANGAIVRQYEILTNEPGTAATTILDVLPAGSYDVRAEGDGIVTEVKRGVQVFAGKDGSLRFVLRPGKGAHIVEYATGGLSREEVSARLSKLENAVAQLQKATWAK